MKLETITNSQQLRRNIEYLEKTRIAGQTAKHFSAYRQLIANGRCFVPYRVGATLHFAPSRFVGYQRVSFEKHAAADVLDGKLTNPAISEVLGGRPAEYPAFDRLYQSFLTMTLGYSGSTHDIRRKYWLTDDAIDTIVTVEDGLRSSDPPPGGTTGQATVFFRKGQNRFRIALIKYWKGCAATRCTVLGVLRASHIKPWEVSTHAERLDPFNGLLLIPALDALFDVGLVTFDEVGRLLYSSELPISERASLVPSKIRRLSLTERHQRYLRFHRDVVFRP